MTAVEAQTAEGIERGVAPPRAERWSSLAVVFGVLSLLFSALIVPGLLAIVFGVLARRRSGRPSWQAHAGIALGVVTVVAGAAVWAVYWDDIFRSPSYRTLAVGDCYARPDDDPRFVEKQSCARPHGREVTAAVEHPAAPGVRFPGVAALNREMDRVCRTAAEAYIGRSLDQAPLRVYRIYPSRESWEGGNRRVVCSLGRADRGPLAGSLRNQR